MVNIAQEVEGVYGARMVGAGFGGCAMILVEEAAVKNLTAVILQQYPEVTTLTPDVYPCKISPGAHRLF